MATRASPNAQRSRRLDTPVGDAAVRRPYAQAARSAAFHERVKAPLKTINLDYYTAGHAGDRRDRR